MMYCIPAKKEQVMRKFAQVVFWVSLGFLVGAMAGVLLVAVLSSNTHDRSVEMTMTAAFFAGPIGAAIGLIVGLVRIRRDKPDPVNS